MSKERELLRRISSHSGTKMDAHFIYELQELLAQPEQDNTQYLLDQVARLTAENAMLKEKWSTPKHEPLSNEQKRLEAIAIKQREVHGIGGGE